RPDGPLERLKRIGRSSLVGIVATVADLAVFETCLRLLGLNATLSKGFAVAIGTTVQFVGSRTFAFRAQRGRLVRQIRWFILVEVLGFAFTVVVAHLLFRFAPIPREISSLLSGSIVYFGFSYPI